MSALGFDPAQWPRISELLDQALALAPDRREQWLAGLASADAGLRGTLASLLAAEQGPDPELPALGAGPPGSPAEAGHRAGDTVGPYRLLSELGRGGMGSVWLARRADGQLARPVALKLPRHDRPSPGLAERLARERDLLAALSHPHIAQLYDAGVDADGQPWLALEMVSGVRIDHWVRERALPLRARLDLFGQVTQAVAHAHARLIVHRDLKPQNLLVDGSGQVKLLDFGIAKLLADGGRGDSTLTREGARPMTPAYASPEQVAGLDVDTRSDVYALGVLLYELLTDQGPYRPVRASAAALEDAIVNELPRRPSDAVAERARARALRGDLDTIVLTALRKDPAERYATVQALGEDIRRHLELKPVLARPESAAYVLRRLLARHRLAFAAGTLAIAAVVGGAAVAAWQAHRADREAARAGQVKAFAISLLRDASPYYGGDLSKVSAADLLRQAERRLEAAAPAEPEVAAELMSAVGEGLASFGDHAAGDRLIGRAITLARARLGDEHLETLRARLVQLQLHRFAGRQAEFSRDSAEVLALARRLGSDQPEALVLALLNAALEAHDRGDYAAALGLGEEAHRLAQARLGADNPERISVLSLLALETAALSRFEQTREYTDQALAAVARIHGSGPHPRRMEALSLNGRARAETGDLEGGIRQIEAAIAEGRRTVGPDHQGVGVLLQNVTPHYTDLGRLDEADARIREALRVLGLHMKPDSYAYAFTRATYGAVKVAQRDADAALVQLEPAAASLLAALGPAHALTQFAQAQRVQALAMSGRHAQARVAAEGLAQAASAAAALQRSRAAMAQGLALHRAGDASAAVRVLQALVAEQPATPKARRERMRALAELGAAQHTLGDGAAARQSWQQALDEIRALESAPTPLRSEVERGLALLAR